ncbi:MAG: hypothetical protein GY757_61745 [bacterium]|nr:hypothetical protein [bacterium]
MNKNDTSHLKWKWTDEHRVTSYDTDAKGKAPLPALARFLQEAAHRHANHLGFGYDQLIEKNLFWVLSRLSLTITKYPVWGDRIFVRTWPTFAERLYAFRDFQILDENGSILVSAGSAWLMLDKEKHRPRRPLDFAGLSEKASHFSPDRSMPQTPPKVPNLTTPETGPLFPVRYSDLDLYEHVNNAKYIQWILDGFPWELHRQYEIAALDINFLSEAKIGDEISIQTEKLDEPFPTFLHCVKRKGDNKDICLAAIKWRNQ